MTSDAPTPKGSPVVNVPAPPVLTVTDLGVTYGKGPDAVEAVGRLDFEIPQGSFVCVVGPSGCGKTTMLRAFSGLLAPTRGTVMLEGSVVREPPRDLALVFQDYSRSLFPWLRVQDNVTFALKAAGVPRAERDERAARALAAVGLSGAERRYPWQLSGGMQQRVAIARAVAYEPAVLLMDEPFASVDAQVRADLEDLVLRIHEETEVTMVLVTHDIDEAVYLSDHVVVLSPRPSHVVEVVDVDLPRPRDQVATKSLPRFAELRNRIYRHIHPKGATAPEALAGE